MSRVDVGRLGEIAEVEFSDIVADAVVTGVNQLRIIVADGSFIDIWFSLKLVDRYSYHWERRAIDDTIYRHDNAPHRRWESISTFPKHFHDGSEQNVIESYLSNDPEKALREFLSFVHDILQSSPPPVSTPN